MDAVNAGKAQVRTSKNSADTFTASSAGLAAAYNVAYEKGNSNPLAAYKDDPKKDLLSEAVSFDPKNSKNYMVVMSNTLSDEDYAKLLKDGEKPGDITPEETVTVLDQIKVTLARAGVYIPGYTDDIDDAAVREIAGSAENANAIINALKEKGIPETEENISDISTEMKKAEEITELTDGAKKYLIQNEAKPTIDNLYKAAFAGDKNAEGKMTGYFSAGTDGYFVQKGENDDIDSIKSQIEDVLEKAGYPKGDKEALNDAEWLLNKGLPLTEENLYRLRELNEMEMPVDKNRVAMAAADAISAGMPSAAASLMNEDSYMEKAEEINEKTQALENEDIKGVIESNKKLTLRNLFEMSEKRSKEDGSLDQTPGEREETLSSKEAAARITLAKVQLSMSAQANLKLLRTGINIELEPLDKLVRDLEVQERAFHSTQLSDIADKTEEIKGLPAETIGLAVKEQWILHGTFTLSHVHEEGTLLKQNYIKAGESYEAMMTAPRADLGDKIKDAFRNIEDILTEENLEPTEENKRAARILGYNTMEISRENIYEVKNAAALLDRVINELTPARALHMIREGVNPLEMNLDGLSDYLSSLKDPGDDMEKYSTFLQKLDHDKNINAEEREAYIGIYRLLRQIEKGDDAAIGGVIKRQQELSLSSLLSAVRTEKKGSVDIKISECFGFLSEVERDGDLITDQIGRYFRNRAASLLNDLGGYETNDAEGEPLLKEEIGRIREGLTSSEEIYRELESSDIERTVNNLTAQEGLISEGGIAEKLIKSLAAEERKEDLKKAYKKVREAMEKGSEEVKSAMGDLISEASEAVDEAAFASGDRIDVKALSLISKQLSLVSRHAESERYYVPIELGDRITTASVRFIKGTGEGSVRISLKKSSDLFGDVSVEFKSYSRRIEGTINVADEGDIEKFSLIGEMFKDIAVEEFDKTADITCVQTRGDIYSPAKREDTDTSPKELYRIADRWLKLLSQEVS